MDSKDSYREKEKELKGAGLKVHNQILQSRMNLLFRGTEIYS